MAVSILGNIGAADTGSLTVSPISQQDFFRILITQLSFQDPLKPIDNEAFVAQLAQFTALEQARETNTNISNLLSTAATTQSVGLLGKTVQVNTASGAVVGTVTTVTFANGSPVLNVQGTAGQALTGIPLSQVSLVR